MGHKLSRSAAGPADDHLLCPTGLYPDSTVDLKKLRRLILEGKLSPCYKGLEEDEASDPEQPLEDCPICFLMYPAVNRSRCCGKGICTECFLQVKPRRGETSALCPFCKAPCYAVEYRGPKSPEEHEAERIEQQRVIEHMIRSTQDGATPAASAAELQASPPPMPTRGPPAAGQAHEKRSVCTAAAASSSHAPAPEDPEEMMVQHAMWLSAQEQSSGTACSSTPAEMKGIQTHGSKDNIINEMLVMMGLAEGNGAGRGDSTVIDEIITAMLGPGGGVAAQPLGQASGPSLPDRASQAGAEASSSNSVRDGRLQHLQSQASLSATRSLQMDALSRYLLQPGKDPSKQIPEQELRVGMVMVEQLLAKGTPSSSTAAAASAAVAEQVSEPSAKPQQVGENTRAEAATGPPRRGSEVPSAPLVDLLSDIQLNVAGQLGGGEAGSSSAGLLESLHRDDSRMAASLNMADQISQWSRPSDSEGRPLADSRVEKTTAASDSQLAGRLSMVDDQVAAAVGNRDVGVMAALEDADAAYRERLRLQDEAMRKAFQ